MSILPIFPDGWSIIPVDQKKRPMIPSWKQFQQRRPTEAELCAWAKMKPPAWAVVTGEISGLVVLDFDGEKGKATFGALGLEDVHVFTPNGGHVYFEHPGWLVRTVNGKSKAALGERFPGLDIRADGGYAIFAGRNANGEYGGVINDLDPLSVSSLPAELKDLLGLAHTPEPNEKAHVGSGDAIPAAEGLIDQALARSDGRNNSGFWLACQLRDNRYSSQEAESAMKAYASRVPATNAKGVAEPYLESEALASLEQAYSGEPRDPWQVSADVQPTARPSPLAPTLKSRPIGTT